MHRTGFAVSLFPLCCQWTHHPAAETHGARAMKPAFGFAGAFLVLVVLLPSPVRAQGAIIETLDDLLNRPDAPAFRGTLPSRIDLTASLPAPGNQGPTGSCTSWAITYAAASQAA